MNEGVEITNACPSGGRRSRASCPMTVLPPGRASTTTVAPQLRELRRQHLRDDAASAARGKRHEEVDGLARKRLRGGDGRKQGDASQRDPAKEMEMCPAGNHSGWMPAVLTNRPQASRFFASASAVP